MKVPNIKKTFAQRVFEYKDTPRELNTMFNMQEDITNSHIRIMQKEMCLLYDFKCTYPWYRLEDK